MSSAESFTAAVTAATRDVAAHSRVAAGLRTAILSGELSPGARLVEADLMDLFGASRAGVRWALSEHAAVVEAVAAGEPAKAEAAMREHLRQMARELGPAGQPCGSVVSARQNREAEARGAAPHGLPEPKGTPR